MDVLTKYKLLKHKTMLDPISNKEREMTNEYANHTPLDAQFRDTTSPVWDMSQERMFIENLLSQRFNYFLIFFSLCVAGFANAKNSIYAEIILILGAVIITLFAMVLKRSQQKLDLIFKNLKNQDTTRKKNKICDRKATT